MKKILIGVDEAGRGCLAGSVFAAAVCFDRDCLDQEFQSVFKDSKSFNEKDRFSLYKKLKSHNVLYCFSSKNCSEIDEINILKSTMLAMKESIINLISQLELLYKDYSIEVIVDGNTVPPVEGIDIKAIVKADRDYPVVSAASIVAKCEKDLESYKIHQEYPSYGFNTHKCYGTAEHLEAISIHGPCKYHRMSYEPIKQHAYSEDFHKLKNMILKASKDNMESLYFEISTCFSHVLNTEEFNCLKKIYSTKLKKMLKKE